MAKRVQGKRLMTAAIDRQEQAKRWFWMICAAWFLISAYFIYARWAQIYWFSLGDTDDNMRLMQVRAWLAGQGWYDLRQYRLNPPEGADIHWSRLVDLPLAAIITLLKPFIGGPKAEYVAIATAPMVPLLIAMTGLSVAVRRLIGPWAFVIATAVLLFCQALLSMYMPTRIDHHGWQLAMIPWLVAGIADPKAGRGGITIGLASAISLSIGLEMVPYLGIAAGVIGLRWIFEQGEEQRIRAYALALGGGTAAAYLIFGSTLNSTARCDALSPVWLSAMLGAGALLFLLSLIKSNDWRVKLGSAIAAAAVLAGGFSWAWPQCLSRLEGISPELYELWFSHIREVKPITQQNFETQMAIGFSALIGPLGALFALIRARGAPNFGAWFAVFLLCLCASAMIFWQSRAGPAVQMLSVMGATALGYHFLPKLRASGNILVRVFGTVAAFALISGLAVQLALILKPAEKPKAGAFKDLSSKANAQCATIPSLAPIGRLPKGTVFTFVDLSPRLITLTHHNAISGPYHRNQEALLAVHRAFRADARGAETIIRARRADYVMICPNSSESTIYKAERPNGFYAQLASGKVPDWLDPVTLPKSSPYKMWRVKPAAGDSPAKAP
jgi:hypothetical protein